MKEEEQNFEAENYMSEPYSVVNKKLKFKPAVGIYFGFSSDCINLTPFKPGVGKLAQKLVILAILKTRNEDRAASKGTG